MSIAYQDCAASPKRHAKLAIMSSSEDVFPGIGQLNEGPLHAALKTRYASGGALEVPIDGFVADAVCDGVIYEIQTGSFSGLQRKMLSLLRNQPVVLVHPIAEHSTMIKMPKEQGGTVSRRKVPKCGQIRDILAQLVYIPGLINQDNFAVEVVLTKEEQIREWDPSKRRRLGGWRIMERRLIEVIDAQRFRGGFDLLSLLSEPLPSPFSTQDLTIRLGGSKDHAQKMAYVLRHSEMTKVVDKQGNLLLYDFA